MKLERRAKALQRVLGMREYTERRQELRKLVQFDLERSILSSRGVIRRAFRDSPLVGTESDQINPRPTISGLRDALDEETMIAIAIGDLPIGDLVTVISKPSTHGMPRMGRERTPYRFGRPSWLTDTDHAERVSRIRTLAHSPAGEEPMSSDTTHEYGLSDLLNVYDHLVYDGHFKDATLDEMSEVVGHERIDALKAAIACRDYEVTKPEDGLSEEQRELFITINARLHAMVEDDDVREPVVATYTSPADSQLIDLALSQAGLPPIGKLLDELNAASQAVKDAEARASVAPIMADTTSEATGDIPSGKVTIKKAHEAFGLTRGKEAFDFDVPVWEWEHDHPHVPELDADYVFRPFELFRVLYALITNQRCYLHGHTGSGKTTLIEQVAARLNWPFMRVNFDSEITRMDLIGRDVLANDGGTTTSKFVDGILPQMMSGPYIGCFDELDFVRPDVAYVMQRAFEGNGLLLTEDGGRMVKPNKMFRAFATGNTVGQGDEFGMYQGARPQSMALLDRFTVWVSVDYMSPADRRKLIKSRVPSISEDMLTSLDKYIGEHLEAFKTSKVLQPISPRSYIALGNAIVTFTAYFPATKRKAAIEQAIEATILDRASAQDRAVLKGISSRVFG